MKTIDTILWNVVVALALLLGSVAVQAQALGTTEARQTKKVNRISGLNFDVFGTYTKPAFPLVLPQSGVTGSTLFHDGGAFEFSVGATSYTYSDWILEVRGTCEAGFDSCPVSTTEGTPWELRDVDFANDTARMVFTDTGAAAFNDLAGAPPATVQVFVTSETFTGDVADSEGWDNLCTNAAEDAGLAGAWTAWLSDGDTDVFDRMYDAEFQLLDGTVVANNLTDLTDGTLDAAIALDENFQPVMAGFDSQVWTATETDGRYGNSGTCVSWTSSDGMDSGQVGEATSMDAGWTDLGGGNPCNNANRLYCFSASQFLAEETFATVTFIPEIPEPPAPETEAQQTKKVNLIPGLDYDVFGTYTKPAFPLHLPQSDFIGSTLFHDGGAFEFSVGGTSYTYSDWTFEVRSTCEAVFDPCPVTTTEGTPWELRDVDFANDTARMVFTAEGAADFNDLAGPPPSTVQVFVTSETFTGQIAGAEGWDNLCTNAAKDAGLVGAWTAWLSDGDTDVFDRMYDAEFQLLDGTVVANNLTDLTDGTLDAAIDLDENLATVMAGIDSQVWTATETDGRYSNSGTCVSWTSSDGVDFGQIGEATSMDAGWTDLGGGNPCNNANRLYCFSASQFLAEETFANVSFIPEPSAAALATAALAALGLMRLASRRRRC